ncbi:MAG: RtcB family protein [Bdellovibrionales bacterium]|nr:RtcB family protein [Bdellovibrionales bacterium]
MNALLDQDHWKEKAHLTPAGYYELDTRDTHHVPVRLFLTPKLLLETEDNIYQQIINATKFPGTRLVAITPDTHFGYGVPVGSVLVTDYEEGALAMGPVGYDIGCGMMSAQSNVPSQEATYEKKMAFNRAVMRKVDLGVGGSSKRFPKLSEKEFEKMVRGGAEYYTQKYGTQFDRSRAERHRIPVDEDWKIPWGGKGRPERGMAQLGSLGGGNHFIELQKSEMTDTLFVQVHTGSRGFGHGLATNYFDLARVERPELGRDIDLGYFTANSKHYREYLNAVAAGGNFAILNRLIIYEQIAEAFYEVFKKELSLIYEISHNLVQKENHPEFGQVWVHRKGATRAFPAGHPELKHTMWEHTGHPVLIPGSNKDYSYILTPLPGAVKSAYSVNHGAGRRLSRGEATRSLNQQMINEEYRKEGILVNTDGMVPIDESSQCYKSSDEVINAVVDAGLAKIEHKLWPLSSIKGTDEKRHHKSKRNRKKHSSQHF